METRKRAPHRSTPAADKADSTIGNSDVYDRIRAILDVARMQAVQTVNSIQVVAYWLIGREIIEGELQGARRAGYGQELIARLSERLTVGYGKGFTRSNIFMMRRFSELYPNFVDVKKVHAVRGQSGNTPFGVVELLQAATQLAGASHNPGHFSPVLSWTHYRLLCRVEQAEARAFYEIECVANRWSTRELERQTSSLLYERLTMSRDKRAIRRLAKKGHEVATPADIVKDPVFLEFLGLPESPSLRESDLEQAIITHLTGFLLELGKGFTFVARQQRITLDGEHYFIDLVFYNVLLRCYVLVELAEKNDAVVRYKLPKGQERIFASKYRLVLPSEQELAVEIARERALLEQTGKLESES